ncbi:MAG: flagellar basal-body rod protein FlgG [Oligoflexia bacterium]|nr:flagellar basal-body rod protein FlgG [Oligoflexia bacterium]
MLRALNTAATGMSAQESNVTTIANNIANVNTNGFKKGRTEFEDLLYQTVQEAGARSSANTNYNVGIQLGSGSKVSATRQIHTQGSSIQSNNPFDLMINGEGFFGVVLPNNEVKYTRDGSFSVDSVGSVVTRKGYKLFPGITVPPNTSSVNVTEDGKVDIYVKGQIGPQNVGTIPVFNFMNPAGLRSEGGNLYSQTASSGEAVQGMGGQENVGAIQQGALEASNVSVMNEMTDLIKAQRAYEMNAKVLGIADNMLQTVNNIR